MIKRMDMQFADICEDGDRLWFYDSIQRLICYTDRDFHKIHIEKRIEVKDVENAGAGIAIAKYNKKLFIVFHVRNIVVTYSLLSSKYSVSAFGGELETKKEKIVYKYGDSLYMFPLKIDGTVLIFHMDQETFEKRKWMKKDASVWGEESLFPEGSGEKIFFPVYKRGIVIEVNLLDFQYVLHHYEGVKIGTVCHDADRMWLTQTVSAEVICVGNSGKFEKINTGCGDYAEFFSKLLVFGGKIAALPRYGNYVLLYDAESKKTIRLSHNVFKVRRKGSLTYGYYCVGSLLYLLPWNVPKLLCVDMENGKIDERSLGIDTGEYLDLRCAEDSCVEGEVCLEDYLSWIAANRQKQQGWKEGEKETGIRADRSYAVWRVCRGW